MPGEIRVPVLHPNVVGKRQAVEITVIGAARNVKPCGSGPGLRFTLHAWPQSSSQDGRQPRRAEPAVALHAGKTSEAIAHSGAGRGNVSRAGGHALRAESHDATA